jgi:hypothetical protein
MEAETRVIDTRNANSHQMLEETGGSVSLLRP